MLLLCLVQVRTYILVSVIPMTSICFGALEWGGVELTVLCLAASCIKKKASSVSFFGIVLGMFCFIAGILYLQIAGTAWGSVNANGNLNDMGGAWDSRDTLHLDMT